MSHFVVHEKSEVYILYALRTRLAVMKFWFYFFIVFK
jgi:hypothetical protein